MANSGHMLGEQVWDRQDSPANHLRFGELTGSATPLNWACAQFVRLAVAAEEKKIPEMPSIVYDHFRQQKRAGMSGATGNAPGTPNQTR